MTKIKRLLLVLLLTATIFAATGCVPKYSFNTTVSPNNGGTIEISGIKSNGEAIVIPTEPSVAAYEESSLVTLAAKASYGYRFDHWDGDSTATSKTITMTMDKDKSVTAYYIKQYMLSITIQGGGTVSPEGGVYDTGAKITLTATPDPGYRFDRWSGDSTTTSQTITITIDKDKSVTANYIKQYILSTMVSVGGTVSSKGGVYDTGTTVTVTATPNTGYRFDRWSGDSTATSNTITVTMNSDKRITATFIKQYTLSTSVSGGGKASQLFSIYDVGTSITLSATPDPHCRFSHWSGDVPAGSQGSNPVIIIMDSNKNIVANFEKIQHNLTIAIFPPQSGTVSPAGGNLDEGTEQELTARPATGYAFSHWSGDATGTFKTITITMDTDKSVTAYFKMYFSPLFSPVLQGTGVSQAAAYQGNNHPVVFLNASGNAYYLYYVFPQEWLPETVEETQLVAFVGEEYSYSFGTETYVWSGTQTRFTVERIQYRLDITLREAKTGNLVASTTLRGSTPASFPTYVYSSSPITGSHVSFDDVENWLKTYVEP